MAKTQKKKNISKLSLYSEILLSENQSLSCRLEVKVNFYQYKIAKFSDEK